MKTLEQLDKVLEKSMQNSGNCFSLNITNNGAELIGISDKNPLVVSAFVLMNINKNVFIKGWIDGDYYESSSIANLEASKSIIIGVDCSKNDNTKIYFHSGTVAGKFNAHSNITADDSLCIFWEIENQACLTVCAFDPVREEVIREVVSGANEPLKRFLRALVRQNLRQHANVILSRNECKEDSTYSEEDMHNINEDRSVFYE